MTTRDQWFARYWLLVTVALFVFALTIPGSRAHIQVRVVAACLTAAIIYKLFE